LAIRPYPQGLANEIRGADGSVFSVRPIRPEDEPALRQFAAEVDSADLWHPVFAPLRERSHQTAARLSQIDYDREMTMLAWEGERIAGLARSTADPDFEQAEAAVIIRADLRDKGLATRLLQLLFAAVSGQGVRRAVLIYPARLERLRAIAAELGCSTAPEPGDPA